VKMKMIYIEWIDAESIDAWEDYDSANRDAPVIKTLGFLIRETKKYVVIALSIDETNEKCSNRIQIPTGMIKKKRVIK
jgi:hypothetical protein